LVSRRSPAGNESVTATGRGSGGIEDNGFTESASDAASAEHFSEAPLPDHFFPASLHRADIVGVLRGPQPFFGPALLAILAVLMGIFVVSIDEPMSAWVQATVILWAIGATGLAVALAITGPVSVGGRVRRVGHWAAMVAVLCFVAGSLLFIIDTMNR